MISNLNLVAYHCTRSSNPQQYLEHGIQPLGEKVLRDFLSESNAAFPSFCLPEDDKRRIISKIMATHAWEYRLGSGGGPYFFLSYKATKNEKNHFIESGPEIWWVCVDNLLEYCRDNNINLPSLDRSKWIQKLSENSTPLIIHCLIPYAILPEHHYCSFAMLRSYFNILDPEDDFIESGSLDLKGKPLDSKYILKVEEIKKLNSFLM